MNSLARKRGPRLLALLLAALWGGLTLLGAVVSARCQTTAPPHPDSARTVCRCARCGGILTGGRMRCCCCHAAQSPARQAVVQARCDQNHPRPDAALGWGPLATLSARFASAPAPPPAETFRHRPQAVLSFGPAPLLRPPQLL